MILATSPVVASTSLPTEALWIFGIISALGVLVAILVAAPKLWAFLSKFVSTVDVINKLPETLSEITETLAENGDRLEKHLVDAKTKTDLLLQVDARTRVMVGMVEDVRYEVKNNGGGSTKDAVDRIEAGVAGLYALPGEASSPGRQAPGSEERER